MKGLRLAELFFETFGLPMLQERFGAYLARMAVGLVGDGSECFGFDDTLSQDHDWGPGFCIWLEKDDYVARGEELQAALDELPKVFEGYGPRKVSQWGEGRVGVFEIRNFYQRFIGFDRLPATHEEWLVIPEHALAACTNGKVFRDPLGEFSRWRAALGAFYPEDVRLKKIASRCMTTGQAGQYNYPRCVQREEYFCAHYALTKFCADAISLVFLLNRRYTPFYKWMHRAVKDLPLLGTFMHEKISAIVEGSEVTHRKIVIESICEELIRALKAQGLTDSESLFLPDHGPVVQRRIKDIGLRSRNVWVG